MQLPLLCAPLVGLVLALPSTAAPQRVGVSYLEPVANGHDVWHHDSSSGSNVRVLEGVQVLELEAAGYALKDRLRADRPAVVGADTPTPSLRLPLAGSIYRVASATETHVVRVSGGALPAPVLSVPSVDGEPSIAAAVHATVDGGSLLAASSQSAGGDVFRVDLASGLVTLLTGAVGPLDVAAESLRLTPGAAWFVAGGVLYRAGLAPLAPVTAIDLQEDEPVIPELVVAGDAVVALTEKADGKRRLFRVPAVGAPLALTDYDHHARPAFDHPLGPWLVASPDGTRIVYRQGDGDHDLYVIALEDGLPRRLTGTPEFPTYIDSIGVLAFGGPTTLCFFAGDSHVGDFELDDAIGASDMYAADVSDPEALTFVNVTRTNGQLAPPFLDPGTLFIDEVLVGPLGERIFLRESDAQGDARLTCFRIDGGEDLLATNLMVLAERLSDTPQLVPTGAGLALLAQELEPWPTHAQSPNEVACAGDSHGADEVRILATDRPDPDDADARVWFDDLVSLGSSFELDAASAGAERLESDTWVHVYDVPEDALSQSIAFHTSCSEPLRCGDRFGSLLALAALGEDEPEGNDACDGHGVKPRALLLRYTGQGCAATQHGQDSGKVTCNGDPAGAQLVRIRVSDKDDAEDGSAKVWFDDVVALGELFVAAAVNAGEIELKSDTRVHVLALDGTVLQFVKLHTSCSQPLQVGDVYGACDLLAVHFSAPGEPEDFCVFGRPRRMTLSYLGLDCARQVYDPFARMLRPLAAPQPGGFGAGLVGGSVSRPGAARSFPGAAQLTRGVGARRGGRALFAAERCSGAELWRLDVRAGDCVRLLEESVLSPVFAFDPDGRPVVGRATGAFGSELVVLLGSGATQVLATSDGMLLPLGD